MQPKWSRVSPVWSCRWRRLHPRTPSPRSRFLRPTSRLPAERSPGRKPPNPPSLPNLPSPPSPQRYPKPPNPPRCQKSRMEGRRKQRKRKSHYRRQNRPASPRSSPTRKKSWAKWTSPKRQRWSGSLEVVSACLTPVQSLVAAGSLVDCFSQRGTNSLLIFVNYTTYFCRLKKLRSRLSKNWRSSKLLPSLVCKKAFLLMMPRHKKRLEIHTTWIRCGL